MIFYLPPEYDYCRYVWPSWLRLNETLEFPQDFQQILIKKDLCEQCLKIEQENKRKIIILLSLLLKRKISKKNKTKQNKIKELVHEGRFGVFFLYKCRKKKSSGKLFYPFLLLLQNV